MRWKKITLIGVGLLGGSLGLALKRRRLADSVVGFVRRKASVAECQAAGAVDAATRDLEAAVEGAELIVLCTPISQMRPLVERFISRIQLGLIVTDVGSVKQAVVEQVEPLVTGAGGYFVGSHPMAGSEATGVAAARADLFAGAICVVTPNENADGGAVREVSGLWRAVGMRVLQLSPAAHDQFVSRTSHLPQIVASQLATFVLDPSQAREQASLCANGFRDTTRLASSSPEMWRDIVQTNRENILRALDGFQAGLQDFRRLLRKGKPDEIARFFSQARERRDEWLKALPGSLGASRRALGSRERRARRARPAAQAV